MAEAGPDGLSAEKFLDVPYDQRWERLKPVILHLYEREQLPTLIERMKLEYGFVAHDFQYRYRLRLWKIKKRSTKAEKEEVVTEVWKQTRPSPSGAPLASAVGGRRQVGNKQLTRYLRDQIRHAENISIVPGVFTPWNMPYSALVGDRAPSPMATPSLLPANNSGSDPASSPSRSSPTTQLIRRKVLLDRSSLLLSSRHKELLKRVDPADRRLIINYLNDFWLYSFVTAKYWGRGPERWNADMIFFKTMGPPDPQPGSHAAGNVPAGPVMSPAGGDTRAQYRLIPSPTQLCRWSRHTNQWEFESLPSSDPNNYDANDDTTWPAWPEDRDRLTLQEAMATTLGTHDFTSISRHELPMSAEAIAKAAQRSPEQLGIEAFAFAIMSGNMERIRGIFEENGGRAPQQSHKIFPFHLAASFMDASRNCCLVLSELIERLDEHQSIDLKFEDASGHTVLDMLMVNILRSHTTVTPEQISEAFLGQKRFPGEERDICGRWDADSPCIRRLLALGEPRVPAHWKHAFCHTSVLGICHGITALFGLPWAPDINTISSGLFSRSCPACHRHLTLKPLHCLVLVAFHLAQNGRPGETLFGPLACLTALLVHGADPCLRADISVRPLVNFRNSNSNSGGGGGGGSDDQDACDHSLLTAAALSWKVAPPSVVRGWAEETQLGWRVFVKTLKHVTYDDGHCASQIQEIAGEDGDSGMSGSSYNARSRDLIPHDNNSNRHSRPSRQASGSSNLVVGTIWDTVQAEFLKHRRVSEHDPWMSPNFSMGAIEDWLDGRMAGPSGRY